MQTAHRWQESPDLAPEEHLPLGPNCCYEKRVFGGPVEGTHCPGGKQCQAVVQMVVDVATRQSESSLRTASGHGHAQQTVKLLLHNQHAI